MGLWNLMTEKLFNMLDILLSLDWIYLIIGGFFISVFAIVFGGSMFLSVPFIQFIFPGASFGTIVWNLKIGSFFRWIGSTFSTRNEIDYKNNIQIWLLAFWGTVIWASLIANLDQKWIFPAVIIAVLLSILAPKISEQINKRTFHIASFIIGIYAGIFGAWIGILLVALIRVRYTKDTDIAIVKIQARFLEFVLVFSAIISHVFYWNIVMAIWMPWSIWALIWWICWWYLLHSLSRLSWKIQKLVLYFSFLIAIWVAWYKFFSV